MNALRPAIGLALLRVTVGFVFAMHGYQKFFQYGLDGVTGGFTQMGVPLPAIAAPVVATIELVGGLMVILGIYHRIAALLQVGVMVGAIVFAKLAGGFFAPAGFEFELTLGVAALTIVLAGGGAMALQDSLKKGA
jgi:putative oxidoreductase